MNKPANELLDASFVITGGIEVDDPKGATGSSWAVVAKVEQISPWAKVQAKLLDLPLKVVWWRASNTSVDVQRCDDTGSGCIGEPGAMACKDGSAILCEAKGHYYNVEECRECTTHTRYIMLILLLCIGLLLHCCSLPVAKACKPKRRVLLAVWEDLRSLMVKVT